MEMNTYFLQDLNLIEIQPRKGIFQFSSFSTICIYFVNLYKATKSWFSVSQAPPHSFLDPRFKIFIQKWYPYVCPIDLASDTAESFLIVARICYRFD